MRSRRMVRAYGQHIRVLTEEHQRMATNLKVVSGMLDIALMFLDAGIADVARLWRGGSTARACRSSGSSGGSWHVWPWLMMVKSLRDGGLIGGDITFTERMSLCFRRWDENTIKMSIPTPHLFFCSGSSPRTTAVSDTRALTRAEHVPLPQYFPLPRAFSTSTHPPPHPILATTPSRHLPCVKRMKTTSKIQCNGKQTN